MKKSILTFGLIAMAAFGFKAFAQEEVVATPTSGAEISINKEVHDYGKIQQHGDGECEFEIKNTGTEPLIISNAKGSCGCTVPDWPREPIAPGAMKVMKVKYATNRIGPINKSVTITCNAVTNPTMTVRIKGEVLSPTNEATPELTPAGPVNN